MITIKYVDLPLTVRGCSSKIGEEEFLILINRLLPEEIQSEALEHEQTHIRLGHFERDLTVEECEREVYQIINDKEGRKRK